MWNEAEYRAALGSFATGVTVVTVRDDQGVAHGLTVNSFTSVSLAPPLVLWGLGVGSDAFSLFKAATHYGVSILPAGDVARAMRFAGRGDQTLVAEETEPGPLGLPLLKGALARLECEVTEQITAGDHLLLLAKTKSYDSRPGDGLTYFRGSFGTAVQEPKR